MSSPRRSFVILPRRICKREVLFLLVLKIPPRAILKQCAARQPQAGDKSKYLANADFKISSEAEFLSAIKERILVLFEGLNAFEKGDLNARVELNLKFMEFLLASIENRLENLSK